MDTPQGYEDPQVRKDLAARLKRMVTAFEASVGEKFDRYELALFGTGTFTYFANGVQNGHSTSFGPYKYIAWTHQDRGGPCQIGCADIRVLLDDKDIGP